MIQNIENDHKINHSYKTKFRLLDPYLPKLSLPLFSYSKEQNNCHLKVTQVIQMQEPIIYKNMLPTFI